MESAPAVAGGQGGVRAVVDQGLHYGQLAWGRSARSRSRSRRLYMGGIYESAYCVKTVSLFLELWSFETLLN